MSTMSIPDDGYSRNTRRAYLITLDIYVLIEFIYNNMYLFIVYLSFRMCMSPWFVRIILDTGLWIDLLIKRRGEITDSDGKWL